MDSPKSGNISRSFNNSDILLKYMPFYDYSMNIPIQWNTIVDIGTGAYIEPSILSYYYDDQKI